MAKHTSSHDADEALKKAKAALKKAQAEKADADTIKSLKKDVANAQAVRNLF